jgi:hypothetical protein
MSAKQAQRTTRLTELPIGWAGSVNEIAPATVLAAVGSSHHAGMALNPDENVMF